MSDRPLRIAYIPFIDANNAYVSRMQDVLRTFGAVEKLMHPRLFVRQLVARRFRRYDATIFNWIENDALRQDTRRIDVRRAVIVLMKTLYAHLVSRRVVFVRHNIYPHAIAAGQEETARRWIDRYERLFHAVYSHSGARLERRHRYCPHPLYRSEDGRGVDVRAVAPGLPRDYFVVFGRVARYKRIVELARSFPAEKNLLIIGLVTDDAYGRELASVDRPNVYYRPGYLDDAAAQNLIRNSNGVMLAHAGESTVVSGSFFYAMSLPVPVLAVETPFLRWVESQVGDALLMLAPDLDGLVELVRRFEPRGLPADAAAQLARAFGDEAIAAALKPVLLAERGS